MSTFVKKNVVPESVVGTSGSAKRNIIRKGGSPRSGARKDGISGRLLDDGSMYVDSSALDENDPNFDSEEETGFVSIPTYAALHRKGIAKSKITLGNYKKLVEPFITEFFINEDVNDIASSILEVEAPEYSYEFVKRLVSMSLDKGDREKELVSKLFSALYPDILSSNSIGKGFERLFEIVDELEKDVPATRHIVSTFLARCVVDEVLPPSFLADSVVCNLGGEMVDSAKLMLSQDHAGAKLEHSWGPGDGRPVDEMKITVDQILQEFLLNADHDEAVRCLVELNAPYFYHEIVKRAVINSLDADSGQQAKMSSLLSLLHSKEILSTPQAVRGFNRLYLLLPDLVLDTPGAGLILVEFTIRAKNSGVIHDNYQPAGATAGEGF